MAERETQEVPSEHQKALFYWEGDQELLQITQRGARLSILADTQTFSGVILGNWCQAVLCNKRVWPPEAPFNLNHSVIL